MLVLKSRGNDILADCASAHRERRVLTKALLSGVQVQLAPQRQQLDDIFQSVSRAAEAGDFEEASKLFRRAMYAKEHFQEIASETADRAIDGAAYPLLANMRPEQLEAAQRASSNAS
jgi:hypothetical protein